MEREPSMRDRFVKEGFLRVAAGRRRWLLDWRPDDEAFWRDTGRVIALRNLILSMPPLLLSFAVWMVWRAASSSSKATSCAKATAPRSATSARSISPRLSVPSFCCLIWPDRCERYSTAHQLSSDRSLHFRCGS